MEHDLLVILLQILVLLASAKALEALFRRLGFPALAADLLAGILWGPGVFGLVVPAGPAGFANVPDSAAWFSSLDMSDFLLLAGAFLFFLTLGLEVNFPALGKQRRRTLKFGIGTFLVPGLLLGGIALAAGGLFSLSGTGTAFVILLILLPSLPQGLESMRNMELLKTDLGLLGARLLSGMAIVGITGISLVLVLARPGIQGPLEVIWRTFVVLGFTVVVLIPGRLLMNQFFRLIHRNIPHHTGAVETTLILAGLLLAVLAMVLGSPPFQGVFLAGLICGASFFYKAQYQEYLLKSARSVLVPLCFALTGSRLDLAGDFDPLLLLGAVTGVLLFRCLPAFAGARLLGLKPRQAGTLALLVSRGGEVQILAGLFGLGAGIINHQVFIALALGALVPGLVSSPLLRLLIFPKARKRLQSGLQHHIHSHSPDLGSLDSRLPKEQEDETLARPGIELVLRTLCYDLEVRKRCDPESTLQALLDREEAFSTALSRGLAVPHAEIPGLGEFTVFASRCESALDWNSPDGEGTRVFVLILIPPGRTPLHLQFLKQLARTWSRQEVRADCLACQAGDFSARLKFWMEDSGTRQFPD